MSRSVTSTMNDAINHAHGYSLLGKLEVYPTRIFLDALVDDDPVPSSDALGIVDDPLKQDIVHNSTAGGLVTFYADGAIKYARQGNGTPVTTTKSSSTKPGVLGNVIFIHEGSSIKRYSIDWSLVSSGNTNPFTLEATLTPSKTPVAIHAISATECIAVCNDEGGFTLLYFNGTTEVVSTSRFMFPKFVEWEGSGRSMESLGIFSGAALLSGKPFVYMSNASSGMVQGVFYDPDTGTWSDIFTALPTDLQVSLCEFRIANCYTRNNFIYMTGQFHRTDVYGTAKDYSLLLRSEDGKSFSIDSFTLVSDIGYRFLATTGSDNNLYLGNCNRVTYAPLTWYFDGDDDSTSQKLDISEDGLGSISDSDTGNLTVSLKAGNEQYVDSFVEEYARVKFFTGYKTTVGDEFVLYGTYIIDGSPRESYRNGNRSLGFNAINVSVFKNTGLSMPFYAEILGLSSIYDPMTQVSGKLYAAPNAFRAETKFQVDFWQWEGYVNTASSITAAPNEDPGGGLNVINVTGAHKSGMILKSSLADILGLVRNPKITATSLTVKIHGWSKAGGIGLPNDTVNVVLVHCDENGEDEQTVITTGSQHWKITYPYQATGEEPIQMSITGLTVGRYIKFVGLVFECAYSTQWIPARIEFVDNVEIPVSLATGDIPWTLQDDGTFKVPSAGQPFVMFAQKPYNTPNFLLAARFSNSVTGNVTGYPVAVGLVGLAEDASNCIVARFDTTSNKAQLVKMRSGIETVLAEATPGFTVTAEQSLEFKHKDGKFELYIFRDSTSQYELVLTYTWQAADGFMFTSRTAAMKCGMYGFISAPLCRILAFSKSDTESVSTDGLPIDPLADITDFPSSGKLRIGNNVYNYSGKISHPALVRGPYQLRNVGVYPPPFGDGHPGVETRDFDWYATAPVTAGKLIAIDTGDAFLSVNDQWRIFITTGGSRVYYPNRSRYYSANSAIAQSRFSTVNRVWIVGGFSGVGLYSGESTRHGVGEYVILELSGEIKCHWFMGSGGESDTVIEDLINRICQFSGAKANFPGDYLLATLDIGGGADLYQDDYAEGFDLSFEIDAPASFEIRTNVKIKPDNYEEVDDILNDTGTKVVVDSLGSGNYVVKLVSTPSNTIMFQHSYTSGSARQFLRILYYGSNVSIHQNNRWVTTITLDKLIYTQASYIDIDAYSASYIALENIRIKDLGDWREAVYIDLETDGNAAIGSVIQERPVEIVSQSDGSLDFYYEYTRQLVTLSVPPQRHSFFEQDPKEAGSDGIIYGSGDVQTIQYAKFAKSKGLATRLIRVPNLDVGALETAQRMMDRMYESRGHHDLELRPNIRIQPGDKLAFNYTLAGTGTVKSYTIIVESVSLSIQMGKTKTAGMKITGRNTLP